ncbi:MAG: NAD-dependent malic enzyme [Waddliaceae bacterium]|nr:NAD-dependent malic enzyme [Waddliaceae bacterium]
MSDYYERSLELHRENKGKIEIGGKVSVETRDDLSLAYTPGVAQPCKEIFSNPDLARVYTSKANTVAVVTDGSAVLGLGNIGPLAALPVMEGKALLFKKYGAVDAWPICLDTQDTEEIIETVRRIAPCFGGINLEDIAAPKCFEIEERLQDLGIPVFHDDQHGTAIVLLAALLNSARVLERDPKTFRVVISGAGAAGNAIARFLVAKGFSEGTEPFVKEVIVCDSKGAISKDRQDLNLSKQAYLNFTNPNNENGDLATVLEGKDVFIGVSQGGILQAQHVKSMAKDPLIFAMANPIPEIMPDEALAGGAAIIGTGRSDFPNQINNVLAFPGLFRGALDANAPRITPKMYLAAVHALIEATTDLSVDKILPHPLNPRVGFLVGDAVKRAALEEAELSS